MMMNEFGVPINDAEVSMLPPGVNKPHEKLIAESGLEQHWWQAAIGIGMGILGWSSSRNAAREQNRAMERQNVLDKKMHKYKWQESQDAYTFAQEGVDIQRKNQDILIDYKNDVAVQEWQDREKMRIFDYNNQVASYNASIKRFEKQLDYNALASEISLNDNTRKYNERLTEIGFKNEDMLMQLGFNTRTLTQQMQGKQSELIGKGEAAKLEGLSKKGEVINIGQAGRSAGKNVAAILAETARTQAAIVDVITNDESAYALSMEKAYKEVQFGQKQLKESMKSAKLQYEADAQHIELKKWEADMSAEDRIAPMPTEQPQLSKPLTIPKQEFQDPKPGASAERWGELEPVIGARADTGLGPLVSGINMGISGYNLAMGASTP